VVEKKLGAALQTKAVAMGKILSEKERLRRDIMTKMPRRKRTRCLFLLEVTVPVTMKRPLVPSVEFAQSTYTDDSATKAFRFDLAGMVELYTKL
jgi:hypothetical protein